MVMILGLNMGGNHHAYCDGQPGRCRRGLRPLPYSRCSDALAELGRAGDSDSDGDGDGRSGLMVTDGPRGKPGV